MKLRLLLALIGIGALSCVCAQSRNNPVDAGSLRGKRIQNPLSPLDRQGLGWDTANQRFSPTSYATQSGSVNFCAPAGGSATTYTCNLTPALSAYSAGLIIVFKPDVNNSGASTLNVNSLGAKNIQKLSSGSLVSLSADDLDSDAVYTLRYNGTVFVVDPSSATSSSGLFQTMITDLKASATTTVITIAPGVCWGTSKTTMTLTRSGGSGNGTWVAYCTDSQTVVIEYSSAAGLTVSASGLVPIAVTTPTVPAGMYAIASGTISSGFWSTTVADSRDFTTYLRLIAGTGMTITCAGGVCTIAVDSAVVQIKTDTYAPVGRLDVTGATSSAPAKTGTSLPGTCTVGDQYFKSDATAGQNLYGCTSSNTWTVLAGGGAISITSDLYWPFSYPGETASNLNPGANVQRAYKFTPIANYSFSKIRYKTSGTGYVAFAIVTSNGNTVVTNSAGRCDNSVPGAGQGYECSLGGTVSLTAGASYYFVFTADASTGIVVSANIAGDLGYALGTGFGTYIGQAANNSTGSAGTLAVSVPLGTISPITGSIAGNQPPAIVFVP